MSEDVHELWSVTLESARSFAKMCQVNGYLHLICVQRTPETEPVVIGDPLTIQEMADADGEPLADWNSLGPADKVRRKTAFKQRIEELRRYYGMPEDDDA